jgi:exodeoxyribonuclease V beta subunit
LLYVALTRPRHAMWLGVADVEEQFRYGGLAYLLGLFGDEVQQALEERLQSICADCSAMQILHLPEQAGVTRWLPRNSPPPVYPASVYQARFERDWAVVSYSSITRGLGESVRTPLPLLDKLGERDDSVPDKVSAAQVWHGFPRAARFRASFCMSSLNGWRARDLVSRRKPGLQMQCAHVVNALAGRTVRKK